MVVSVLLFEKFVIGFLTRLRGIIFAGLIKEWIA